MLLSLLSGGDIGALTPDVKDAVLADPHGLGIAAMVTLADLARILDRAAAL